MFSANKLHLFCRVVDNFGDIGVCWRLARQLANEHFMRVTLWVDDLASFRRIFSAIDSERDVQQWCGVVVRRWHDDFTMEADGELPDVVVEAFGCDLPQAYLRSMAAQARPPLWINLEYLSAEPWVEGCHALGARHPALPVTRHFFFPGFTDKTGGVLAESGLADKRNAFQGDAGAVEAYLSDLGVDPAEDRLKVSLFCYPAAPVAAWFDAMATQRRPVLCLVPEGVATDAVQEFLQCAALPGAHAEHGALRVQVLPFLDQADYDKLLWSCDLNFVRGEDSFVRAQWAARPFAWQIYPQQEGAHWQKLHAFLERYLAAADAGVGRAVTECWQAWNGAGDMVAGWGGMLAALPQLSAHAAGWANRLGQHSDFATQLLLFIAKNSKNS